MKNFYLFFLVFLLIGCGSVKLPSSDATIPMNKDIVILDMTYIEAGAFLAQKGYIIETSNKDFKQFTTSFAPAKHSNFQQEIRIEGTEINGKMQVKAKYKNETLGEGYGCKCSGVGGFFKAPFYELVWIFEGKISGYDWTGEKPSAGISL